MDKFIDIAKGAADAYCYSQSNIILAVIIAGAVGIGIGWLIGRRGTVK